MKLIYFFISLCFLVSIYLLMKQKSRKIKESFENNNVLDYDPLLEPVTSVTQFEIDNLHTVSKELPLKITEKKTNIQELNRSIKNEKELYNIAHTSYGSNVIEIDTLSNAVITLNSEIRKFSELFIIWKASKEDDNLDDFVLSEVTSEHLKQAKFSFFESRKRILNRLRMYFKGLAGISVDRLRNSEIDAMIQALDVIEKYYQIVLDKLFHTDFVPSISLGENQETIDDNWRDIENACTNINGSCWIKNPNESDGGYLKKRYNYVFDKPTIWPDVETTCTRHIDGVISVDEEYCGPPPDPEYECKSKASETVYQVLGEGQKEPRYKITENVEYEAYFENDLNDSNKTLYDLNDKISCKLNYPDTDFYLDEQSAVDKSTDNCHNAGRFGDERFSCWGINGESKINEQILNFNVFASKIDNSYSKTWDSTGTNSIKGNCGVNSECRSEAEIKEHIIYIQDKTLNKDKNNWACYETVNSTDDLHVTTQPSLKPNTITQLYKKSYVPGAWNNVSNQRNQAEKKTEDVCRTKEDVYQHQTCLADNYNCYIFDPTTRLISKKIDTAGNNMVYKKYDPITQECSTNENCLTLEQALELGAIDANETCVSTQEDVANKVSGMYSCWGITGHSSPNSDDLFDYKIIDNEEIKPTDLDTFSKTWLPEEDGITINSKGEAHYGICRPNETCRRENDVKNHVVKLKDPLNWNCYETEPVSDDKLKLKETDRFRMSCERGEWDHDKLELKETVCSLNKDQCRKEVDVLENVSCLSDNYVCHIIDSETNMVSIDLDQEGNPKMHKNYALPDYQKSDHNFIGTCTTIDCLSLEDALQSGTNNAKEACLSSEGVTGRYSCWGLSNGDLNNYKLITEPNISASNLKTFSKKWIVNSINSIGDANYGTCVPNDTCRRETDIKDHISNIKKPPNWQCYETVSDNYGINVKKQPTGTYHINCTPNSWDASKLQMDPALCEASDEICRTYEDVTAHSNCLSDNHICYKVDENNNVEEELTDDYSKVVYKMYNENNMSCSSNANCMTLEEATLLARNNCLTDTVCHKIGSSELNNHGLVSSMTIVPSDDMVPFENGALSYFDNTLKCLTRECQPSDDISKEELCSRQSATCYIYNEGLTKHNQTETFPMRNDASKCVPNSDCKQTPFCSYQKVLTNNGTTFDPNEVGLTDCSANTAFGKKYEWLLETSQSDSVRLPGTYTADFRAWTADLSGENNTCIRDTSVFVDEDNHDYSEGPKEIVGLNDDNFRCQCDDTDYDLRYFRTDDPNTILATERDICKPTDCGNVTYFTQKVKKDSACIGDDRKDRSANLIKVCNNDCQRLCLEKSWRGGDNKCFVKESKNRTLGAFLYQNGQCIENPNCGPGTDCPRKTDRPPLGNKSGWNMTTNPIGCPTNQNVIDHTRSRKKQNEIYKKEFTSTDLSSGCVPKNYEYQHNINNAEAAGYCPRDCKYTSSAWSSTCTPELKETRTITKHNATDGGNNNNCPAPSVIQNCSIQSQFPLPPTLSLKIKDTNSFEINITENSNGAALLQNPKYQKSVTGPGSPRIDFTNNSLTVARITNCQQNKSYTVRITKKFLNGVPDKHTDITIKTDELICLPENYEFSEIEATFADNSTKTFSSVELIKSDESCECQTTPTYLEKYKLIDPSSCNGPNIKNGPAIEVECSKICRFPKELIFIANNFQLDTVVLWTNKFGYRTPSENSENIGIGRQIYYDREQSEIRQISQFKHFIDPFQNALNLKQLIGYTPELDSKIYFSAHIGRGGYMSKTVQAIPPETGLDLEKGITVMSKIRNGIHTTGTHKFHFTNLAQYFTEKNEDQCFYMIYLNGSTIDIYKNGASNRRHGNIYNQNQYSDQVTRVTVNADPM
jgi:hypothetical protein